MENLLSLKELIHVDRFFVFEKVTDFLEVLKTFFRAVEHDVVDDQDQVVVQVRPILSLLVSEQST